MKWHGHRHPLTNLPTYTNVQAHRGITPPPTIYSDYASRLKFFRNRLKGEHLNYF